MNDANLKTRLPDLVRTYCHPAGICRVRPDPGNGAVVDPDGNLYGLDGVMVVDASIMPDIPRANTNLPTMMIAEKLSAQLNRP